MADPKKSQKDADDAAFIIIQQIYDSSVIPENHKDKYVNYILEHGFSEKMITELDKLFAQEEDETKTDIESQEKIIQGLEELVAEEDAKNDQAQAEVLLSTREINQGHVKAVQNEIEQTEKDFEVTFEAMNKEVEKEEVEAIKEKLAKKK